MEYLRRRSDDFMAVATHALGLRTHHLDLLGDDHEGDLVRALHRDRGIPLTEAPLQAPSLNSCTRA